MSHGRKALDQKRLKAKKTSKGLLVFYKTDDLLQVKHVGEHAVFL